MTTLESVRRTGLLMDWMEGRQADLVPLWTKAEPDAELSFVEWKYIILSKNEKMMKKPFIIQMVAPCDKEGNVLEEPEEGQFKKYLEPKSYEKRHNEYQEALETVLFEGVEYTNNKAGQFMIRNICGSFYEDYYKSYRGKIYTVGQFITEFQIKPTQNYLDQIGLGGLN